MQYILDEFFEEGLAKDLMKVEKRIYKGKMFCHHCRKEMQDDDKCIEIVMYEDSDKVCEDCMAKVAQAIADKFIK